MVLHHFSFVILFIPLVIGINSNTTVKSSQSETNANNSGTFKTLITVNNTHGISLVSEGGTIVSEIPIILKETNNTSLIKAQTDTLLESSSKSKGTVARKGVKLEDAPEPRLDEPSNMTEVKLTPKLSSPLIQNKTVLLNKLVKQTTLKPITHNPVHKPSVLSYEALKSIIPEGTSLSAKGTLTKQVLNPGSHPGMVMPVVITVLVVPMFAVLGYLALKRGQEAWKNRHYKRMDFLLDGMYND